MSPRILAIDTSRVVHDASDGEVLAIRADTGTYFSMAGSAADAWQAIAAHADERAIATMFTTRYDVSIDVATAAATSLVDRLLAEALIVEHVGTRSTGPAEDVDLPSPLATLLTWTEPNIEVYTDMQDLLLFDPIHEVGPEGWPNIADEAR